MTTKTSHINCPQCNAKINIKDAFIKDIKKDILKDEALKIREEQFNKFSNQLSDAVKENELLSDQLIDQNQLKTKVLRLEREKKEIKSSVILEKEQEFQNKIDEKDYQIREKDIQLDKLKEDINKIEKGISKGSQQLQGEAKELVIEEWLENEFPIDNIIEIKKGIKGSDCIHEIHMNNYKAGRICIESKRTEKFQNAWIGKIKEDAKEHDCSISIIVSDILPKDLKGYQMNGVWICTFYQFKSLIHVLRNTICETANALSKVKNRTDSMSLLYNFVTSQEFYHNVETFVTSLVQQQEDLSKEKRSIQSIWKKRETELTKMMTGVSNIYGSLKGITGNSMKVIEHLELPHEENNVLKITDTTKERN